MNVTIWQFVNLLKNSLFHQKDSTSIYCLICSIKYDYFHLSFWIIDYICKPAMCVIVCETGMCVC